LFSMDKVREALATFEEGLKQDPSNEEFKALIEEALADIKDDEKIPQDHPLRIQYKKLWEKMRGKGCNIDKYKVKWFTEDFRGCVAAKNIKSGEEVVRIKQNCILVDKLAHKHPLLKDYKIEDNKEYRYLLAIFVHLER